MKNEVFVKVLRQGQAVCGQTHGLKLGRNVAAFKIEGMGKTGRIYVDCTGYQDIDGEDYPVPTIALIDGPDEQDSTDICFPDFPGWTVHAVEGGKTMAVCLTLED